MPTRAEQAADWGGYIRTLRVAAVADGRCYECRKRPARPGLRRCQVCTDRNRQRRRDTAGQGTCYNLCGRPRAPGRARCAECLDKAKRATQTWRAARAANTSLTSAVPSVPSLLQPTDGPRKDDPAHPAEVGT